MAFLCCRLRCHGNDPSLDDPIPQEYALFLCPTGPLLDRLQEFWRDSKRQCAKNRAHEVFPHVTLCDFFTVSWPQCLERPWPWPRWPHSGDSDAGTRWLCSSGMVLKAVSAVPACGPPAVHASGPRAFILALFQFSSSPQAEGGAAPTLPRLSICKSSGTLVSCVGVGCTFPRLSPREGRCFPRPQAPRDRLGAQVRVRAS